jgi:hydroxyethylthiazole kinase-like uncharacterized protein yjeF
MTELLTASQMRAIENAAIASGEVTGRDLMERAGRGVVDAILATWPERAGEPGKAVVFCGPGNNGGDGYVIARLLEARGWAVRVFGWGTPGTPDAAEARRDWGGEVQAPDELDWATLADRPLVVDAIFGTGLVRAVLPGVWGALELAQGSGCKVVAVDVLSGICSDSGRMRSVGGGIERPVDLTVTFDRPRLGHVLDAGGRLSGRLVVADLGLEMWRENLLRMRGDEVVSVAQASGDLDKGGGHKYAHGHAMVLAGGVGRGGAARLAARGALRVGAGLVTLGCAPGALTENAGRLDAILLKEVNDRSAMPDVLTDRRINALCIGPGLGIGGREAGLVEAVLAAGRSTVLDADALTLIGADEELCGLLHWRCVLTPHGGEFARLVPDIAANLAAEPADGRPAYSRVDAVRAAAARLGCVVLLKGPDTVIAAPDGRVSVNAAVREAAAPWLATAGSGDVLAGFITGLLARGFTPFLAAETGAWLHAECARAFGPGLIAEDLAEELPKVFRSLGL